jgi:hypothetical protein
MPAEPKPTGRLANSLPGGEVARGASGNGFSYTDRTDGTDFIDLEMESEEHRDCGLPYFFFHFSS